MDIAIGSPSTIYTTHARDRFHTLRHPRKNTMIHNNQYSYSFRIYGIILGCLILLLTAGLLSVELGRLYSGSNNRGQNDSSTVYQYLIFPDRIVDYNGDYINPKPENRWMWPWSTATLLFSLIFFPTGVMGIISGQRQSYSSIITFFICALLSICLLIFLIATYSTIIAGWKSIYGTYDGNAMPSFARIDRDLSIACLAISCVLFITLLTSLAQAGISINVCTRKEFQKSNVAYERLPGLNTPRIS